MADFSVQATTLPAPSLAGTNPLPTVTAGPLDNGVGQLLNSIGDIYAKGIGLQKKDEAQKLQTSVVGNYSQSQNDLNTAFSTGQITANELNVRSRKLYSQQVASFPQFADELNKVAAGFGQHSALSDAEAQLKQEENLRQSQLTAASSKGYGIVPGMTKAQQDSVLVAYQAAEAADRQFTELTKRNAESRAQTTFEKTAQQQQYKEDTGKLLVNLAGTHLDATRASGEALISQALADPANFSQYAIKLQSLYGNVTAQINAAASTNPELAGPWRSMFEDQQKLQMRMMDPKENKDLVENELKVLLARKKLAMVTESPRLLNIVGASELLGSNSNLALGAVPEVRSAILSITSTPGQDTPKVVGTEGEKTATDLATAGIKGVATGKMNGVTVRDLEKLKLETKNVNENILTQVGTYLGGNNVDPKALVNITNYIASPEFGAYVVANPLNRTAVETAAKVWKANYVPSVQKAIQSTLTDYLNESGGAGAGARGNPARLLDTVDIVLSSAGVSVVPRKDVSLDSAGVADQNEKLKKVSQAINNMVKVGAHLEGNTDYAAYWEKNKHILMPNAYPAKKGDTVDGYIYLDKPGLRFYDRANWQPVNPK